MNERELSEFERRVETAQTCRSVYAKSNALAASAFAGYATDVALLVAEVRHLRAAGLLVDQEGQ